MAVWNIQSPIEITLRMALKGHNNLVLAVDFNETSIVSGSADRTIKVQSHACAVYSTQQENATM